MDVAAAWAQESAKIAGRVSRLDFTLLIGSVCETHLSAILPLNGRNYLELAKLSMGVVEASGNDQPGSTAGGRAKNGLAPIPFT